MSETLGPNPLRSTQSGVQSQLRQSPPDTDRDTEEFVTDFNKLLFLSLQTSKTSALLKQEFSVSPVCNSPGRRKSPD